MTGWRRGFGMTRISAVTAILICLTYSTSPAVRAQSSATDDGCFPWQEFRNGQCVAKVAPAPPPSLPVATDPPAPVLASPPAPPPPVAASPCLDGRYRNPAGQCVCPGGTHAEAASGRCLADSLTRAPEKITVCDGGTLGNGACTCPAGFSLMPAAEGGGVCARTHAETCLGGELTVSGQCICNGQVTMSGETYLLEYSNGKCLPMRCPVTAMSPDGKCGAASSPAPSLASEPKGESKDDSKRESRGRPAREARDTRDDADEPRHRCGHGRVLTRGGCVPAHRHGLYWHYYRAYRYLGWPRY